MSHHGPQYDSSGQRLASAEGSLDENFPPSQQTTKTVNIKLCKTKRHNAMQLSTPKTGVLFI